jgi:hypothetical protein
MPRPPKPDLCAIVADLIPAAAAAARTTRWKPAAQAHRNPAGTLKARARQLSVYLEPPVYEQLREMAYAERTKMHALMLEALDLLFRGRGARTISELEGK